MDLSKDLIKINQNLATRDICLRIEQRGHRLNIRGPLPSRKQEGTTQNQRISLSLNADLKGLKEAEKNLELVLLELDQGKFNWSDWSNSPQIKITKKPILDIKDALKNFEKAFFADPIRRQSPAGTRTTWSAAYLPYLRRLLIIAEKNNQKIGTNLLYKTLASYSENSRSRSQCATALGALAKHLLIPLPKNWRAESSGYGIHKARFRQLPSDQLILKTWLKIPNPAWRLVYGLMATYGLRNHEVFFSDLSSLSKGCDRIIRILPNTKTGEHQSWPFHPNWVDHFGLEELGYDENHLPKINRDLTQTTLQQVGRRVSEQFRRYKLPITPYDLRHAWAVRTIHIGLPDTVAARMMGHSVAIHTRTYHHWITRRDQQQAVDTALAKQLT